MYIQKYIVVVEIVQRGKSGRQLWLQIRFDRVNSIVIKNWKLCSAIFFLLVLDNNCYTSRESIHTFRLHFCFFHVYYKRNFEKHHYVREALRAYLKLIHTTVLPENKNNIFCVHANSSFARLQHHSKWETARYKSETILIRVNANVIFSRVHFSQCISMKIAKLKHFMLTSTVKKLFSYHYKSQKYNWIN